MLATASPHRPRPVLVPAQATPPNDSPLWHAWVARGRVRDRRRAAAAAKAVKWASVAGLLPAAGLWSHLPPYEVVVRWFMAGGATVLMFQAFRARRYGLAVVFGALALLYNPVAPAFHLAPDWHRYLVVASAIPFVTSLAWRNARLEQIS